MDLSGDLNSTAGSLLATNFTALQYVLMFGSVMTMFNGGFKKLKSVAISAVVEYNTKYTMFLILPILIGGCYIPLVIRCFHRSISSLFGTILIACGIGGTLAFDSVNAHGLHIAGTLVLTLGYLFLLVEMNLVRGMEVVFSELAFNIAVVSIAYFGDFYKMKHGGLDEKAPPNFRMMAGMWVLTIGQYGMFFQVKKVMLLVAETP